MKIDILSRGKKKKIVENLGYTGIGKIDEMLIRSGKEKIRAFSGDLTREEIMDIWHLLPIEGIGLYVVKDIMNRNGKHEVRLTLDGMHVWKEQLKGRVLDLSEEQEVDWFLGRDIELSYEQSRIGEGFVLVRSGEDFVGVGKVGGDGKLLFGFLPKERRRKEKMS